MYYYFENQRYASDNVYSKIPKIPRLSLDEMSTVKLGNVKKQKCGAEI
jgi:hypothetical protein